MRKYYTDEMIIDEEGILYEQFQDKLVQKQCMFQDRHCGIHCAAFKLKYSSGELVSIVLGCIDDSFGFYSTVRNLVKVQKNYE